MSPQYLVVGASRQCRCRHLDHRFRPFHPLQSDIKLVLQVSLMPSIQLTRGLRPNPVLQRRRNPLCLLPHTPSIEIRTAHTIDPINHPLRTQPRPVAHLLPQRPTVLPIPRNHPLTDLSLVISDALLHRLQDLCRVITFQVITLL